MNNTIETIRKIAKEAAAALEYELGAAGTWYRDETSEFTEGKVGTIVNIRAPNQFRGQEGPSMSATPIEDRNIPITINRQWGDVIQMTGADLTLKDDLRNERFSIPIARMIATEIVRDGLTRVLQVPYDVTPAWTTTAPGVVDYREVLNATTRLTDIGTVLQDRVIIMTPTTRAAMGNAIVNLPATTQPSTQALREGEIGRLDNARTFESALLPTLTTGTRALASITITSPAAVSYATATANDWKQTVTLAQTASDQAAWLRAGEVLTFAGCYDVNPITKQALPFLKQFVVMADAALATNAASVSVSPPMIVSGPYQTVAALPSNGATVAGNGNPGLAIRPNIAMHKNALAIATVPKVSPPGSIGFSRQTYKGYTVNVEIVRDGMNDISGLRFDALWGIRLIQPQNAVRWTGRAS